MSVRIIYAFHYSLVPKSLAGWRANRYGSKNAWQILESIGLEYDDKYQVDTKYRRHHSSADLFRRDSRVVDSKIVQMYEDILTGSVLIMGINPGQTYGESSLDGRHAIMIYGFKIDDRGVPIFLGIVHHLAKNMTIEYPARHLIETGELDCVAIGKHPVL